MRAVDIIIKKRDRGELTREEIDFFIRGFTQDEIPDYQAAAWAMAVLLNGMTPRETTIVRSPSLWRLISIPPEEWGIRRLLWFSH
jgi:thymidine phosphorylase